MLFDLKMFEIKYILNLLLCYFVFVLGECMLFILSEIRNWLIWICFKCFWCGGVDESVFKKVWLWVKNLFKILKS